ncbi:MAG: biotin/lipoyl-binding protein [Bacteroidaceae bacterium]|nr:biotin/lipoyl-binding protein [Bacteroidaceae bacterium]
MKQYKYKINGSEFDVTIDSINGSKAKVEVNGLPFDVEMIGSTLVESALPDSVSEGASAPVSAPAAPAQEAPKAAATAPMGAGEGVAVKAPLPGVITSIKVELGQSVKKGETVVVLEAMKMENNIAAENDGVVSGIAVQAGDSVLEGTVLITIA